MGKALLLSLVLVLPAVTASGQGRRNQYRPSDQTSAGAIKFGLKLGASNFGTRHKKDKSEDFKCRILRFHAGAFGEYKFIDKVGLQLALLYSGQGRQEKLDSYLPDREGKGEVKNELKLNYLLGASTLRWYPGADRQFCLFIGPYLGYCMSAMEYQYIDGKQQEPGDDLKANPEDPIKNLDFGIVVGWDYEFAMGLLLGIASNMGLRNLSDNSESSNFGGQLSAGYNFAKLIQ